MNDMNDIDDLKEKSSLKITSHILIRDKNTNQIILNKGLSNPKSKIGNIKKNE